MSAWTRMTLAPGINEYYRLLTLLTQSGMAEKDAFVLCIDLSSQRAAVRDLGAISGLKSVLGWMAFVGVKTCPVPNPVTEMIAEADGRQVWINASDGCCIARFGARIIDIHHTGEMQMQGDQCLNCRCRTLDAEADWAFFKAEMWRWYGFIVEEGLRPC